MPLLKKRGNVSGLNALGGIAGKSGRMLKPKYSLGYLGTGQGFPGMGALYLFYGPNREIISLATLWGGPIGSRGKKDCATGLVK